MWNRLARNLLVVTLFTCILVVLLLKCPQFLGDSRLACQLSYVRGFPWLPALVLAVGLVALGAEAQSLFPEVDLTQGAMALADRITDTAARLLSLVDRRLLPAWCWWSMVALALGIALILWFFPRCASEEELLVSFWISRGEFATQAAHGETIRLAPGQTYSVESQIRATVRDQLLPIVVCRWSDGGIGSDARLLTRNGCIVNYRSGQDNVADSLVLQVEQQHCRPLPHYSFFVETSADPQE